MPARTTTILSAAALVLVLPAVASADQAAEVAASTLVEMRMKNARPADLEILKAVEGKEIFVVLGSMDQIQTVLRASGIPYILVGPAQVAKLDLTADNILMINCPGRIPKAGRDRIEKFVRAGGTLYTTEIIHRGACACARLPTTSPTP